MIRAILLCSLLFPACSALTPCRRVTLLSVDPAKMIYRPHWHIGEEDILLCRDNKAVMTFVTGEQFAVPMKDADIVDERCW